ncbi:MAG: S41 family peptidase [Myxococcota bacterium]
MTISRDPAGASTGPSNRIRRGRGRFRAALAVVGLALWASAPAAAADTELTCERIPQLLSAYFQKHISYGYLNAELRTRTIDSYLKRLDPSKTLFLADEAEALRASLTGVFHDIYSGDCARLEKLQTDILGRYKAMEDYVRAFVEDEDWELDRDVVLIIDPDKRGYPGDEAARERLYQKLVHFQMSNYLGTEMELAEAKRRLIHRYELMTRRAGELESEDIYSAFVDAFATSMDPHSHYLSAEAVEDFQIEMRLSLDGIGVALSSRDGYSVVEKIIPGGATDRLGVLRPKDKVIAVAQEDDDWVDVIDMDLRDVVRLIRGKRGTKVHLRVLRQAEVTETLSVTIVRDKIDLEERSAKLTFEEVGEGDDALKLAIIELPSFYGDRNPTKRQSSRDLRKLLEEVEKSGADGLLLDLSRNGGGLLDTAVEIAGFFIDEGGVVAVKGTDSGVQILRDRDEDVLYDGPMVVLTSRISASASEIVAGALKDYQRAVIVGDDHTFGKGTVQSIVPLPPGLGALKVTTALFFRPGGASTQHSGVRADVQIPALSATEDFGEAHQPYSLPSQKIQPFVPSRIVSAGGAGGDSDSELAWSAVTPEKLESLTKMSSTRVAGSSEFGELAERIEEAKKRDGVIHLAELLEDRDQATAGAGDAAIAPPNQPIDPEASDGGEGDDEPSIQLQEAVAILADWVRLHRQD